MGFCHFEFTKKRRFEQSYNGLTKINIKNR